MQVMPFDRRRRRSDSRPEATHFMLAQVAEDFDLDVFVVADELGDLLATSTRSHDGTEISTLLALFSPMLTESRPASSRGRALAVLADHLEEIGMLWEDDEIVVREFTVNGDRKYVVAVGEATTMREVGIYRAVLGMRRIYGEIVDQVAA